MLIEIDDSVVRSALQDDKDSIRALQLIASAQSLGYHIVWAKRSVLKKIVSLSSLSTHDINIYGTILNKYATITSDYNKIGFRLLVTTIMTTSIGNNQISLNPKEFPNFNYVNRTNLLAENLSDTILFNYIGNYFVYINNLEYAIKIEFEEELGGGDTTNTKYAKYVKDAEKLCICILDGDRKYDDTNAPYGETYKKVKKCHDANKPFNCMYYGTEKLLEVENLIPCSFYLTDTNFKNKQIVKEQLQFDLSFFDLKEGLKYKCITDKNILNYWKKILDSNRSIIKEIETAEYFMNEDIELYKKTFEKGIFIEGFSNNLLGCVLKNKEKELKSVSTKDLTHSQIHEWNVIGKYIMQWCCAVRIPKNSLS